MKKIQYGVEMIDVQVAASVVLIIGTMVVYRQIQYAQDRPVGCQSVYLCMWG